MRSPAAIGLAKRRRVERAVGYQLIWRPELARTMPLEGIEHLRAARRGGRGVIVTGTHFGPQYTILHAVAAQVGRLYVVSSLTTEEPRPSGDLGGHPGGSWAWDPESQPLRGRHGLIQAMMWRSAEESGCRWIAKGGSYGVLRALLTRGDACRLNFDVTGGARTRVAGREFMIASGVASLAMELNVPVVCAFARRSGHRLRGLILPVIEPGDFPDVMTLQEHIASRIDEVVAAHPQQVVAKWPPGDALPDA